MQLGKLERDLIGLLRFCGERTAADLAKELHSKEHSVRHAIGRLCEARIISPQVFVNPAAVGYSEFSIFLTLTSLKSGMRERLMAELLAADEVSWLGAVGGPFELELLVCAPSIHEVARFFDTLCSRVADLEFQKAISTQTAITYFAPRFMGCTRCSVPKLSYGPVAQLHTLDDLDMRILKALLQQASISHRDLARLLGVPASTVQYRINALKKKGVIAAVGYHIDGTAAGLTSALVLVEMLKSSAAIRERMRAFCAQHPNVNYLIESLGAWDFEIGAVFSDSRNAPQFLDVLRRDLEGAAAKLTLVPAYEPLKLQGHRLGRARDWPSA